MLFKKENLIIAALIVTFLVVYYVYDIRDSFIISMMAIDDRDRVGILFDTCVLKELDPWDAEVNKFVNYSYNPFENCHRTVETVTKLEDGKLYVLDWRDNIQCWWQCLYPKNDTTFIRGPWAKLTNGSVPKCDIIETNCGEKQSADSKELTPDDRAFKKKLFYEFLHAQVYRNDTPDGMKESPTPNQPDVHIIVFDSVSHSHFVRAMTKTRHYFREHFEAVPFPYLNKVGINSRRNSFGFLFGKTAISIPKSPLSVGYPHECSNDNACCSLLGNNSQFIGFQFQEATYKTMMSEDYFKSVFTAMTCMGFNSTPVDHYMRPYQLRVDHDKFKTAFLQKNIYKGMCRSSYVPQMEYLQDFLNKYPDKPKFTITWITHLAHNGYNDLIHADEYFYNFFRNNSEKLNNAYTFLMADHGLRYGPARLTTVGEHEDRNPFLMMSLPASLRGNNELQSTLRDNARQLISQYDLYATFVDIVAPYRPENSSKPHLHGSSLLKPLPQPRSCDRLRIPFEFCTCDYPKTKLSNDAAPGRDAADFMIANMNQIIETRRDLSSICTTLSLSSTPVVVESFNDKGSLSVYKVTFEVEPGKGRFSGYVSQNRTTNEFGILSVDRFARLNAFAQTGYCAQDSEYASYCYCNELLSTNNTTLPTS